MAFFELNDDEYWLQAPAQGWDPPAVSVLEMAPNSTANCRALASRKGEKPDQHELIVREVS